MGGPGSGANNQHSKKTTCPRGHPYNRTVKTYTGSGVKRYCSLCMNDQRYAREAAREALRQQLIDSINELS